MRTLCPNLDREDALDTVLEVPIPEEMFPPSKTKWPNMIKSWMLKPSTFHGPAAPRIMNSAAAGAAWFPFADRTSQIQLLLGVIGAPLIPIPIPSDHGNYHRSNVIKDHPIEASMAKYIVQQYVAAVGGDHALNSIDSMYAMGKVKMTASEFSAGELGLGSTNMKNGQISCNIGNINSNSRNHDKVLNVKGMRHGGEVGGFVLWQKRPELWCLELVVSGCKISAGSDGNVAWRQTPWHHSHASRGPPRPLRRSLQGLDPRLTANLFSNSVCIGEKSINDEDCFVLKLEAEPSSLQARSSSSVEVIRHSVWGYFSQRTGLLIQIEDSHLLRIKASKSESIFWETTMESSIQDYCTIDGINVAHAGKTSVSLFRYGGNSENHSRTRMEEVWSIVEVDFNIKGLSIECFLPPADLKKEEETTTYTVIVPSSGTRLQPVSKHRPTTPPKFTPGKVISVEDEAGNTQRHADL
ncbi:hypothetical protein Dimus_033724 [Dionaea muscipula]